MMFYTGKNISEWNEKESQSKENANRCEILLIATVVNLSLPQMKIIENEILFHHFRNVKIAVTIVRS